MSLLSRSVPQALSTSLTPGRGKAKKFPLALSSKVVDLAFMCELHKPKQASELMGCFLKKNSIFIFENSIPWKEQRVPLWVAWDVPPEEAGISSGNHQG